MHPEFKIQEIFPKIFANLGPVVQSVVSLMSSLRVISLTVLADSIYNILHCKSYSHFFSKKFQHIFVSLHVNFNESLTNDIVSFEQLGPDKQKSTQHEFVHKICKSRGKYFLYFKLSVF